MSLFADERNHKRMHVRGTIQYARIPMYNYMDAPLIDGTDRGLCFESRCSYLPDTLLVIRCTHLGGPLKQRARVVWSLRRGYIEGTDRRYKVGVLFIP